MSMVSIPAADAASIPGEGHQSIQVVFPARDMDALADALVSITEAIDRLDPDLVSHGCLGGQHGYGGVWDCDTFTMRPFYWGDCDCDADERSDAFHSVNSHSEDCYSSELCRLQKAAGVHYTQPARLPYDEEQKVKDGIYRALCKKHGQTYPAGCAVHCTCDFRAKAEAYFKDNGHRPTCALELPNFLHKPTRLEVRWYKYIGRGQEVVARGQVDVSAVLADCISAIEKATTANSVGMSEANAPSIPPVKTGEG